MHAAFSGSLAAHETARLFGTELRGKTFPINKRRKPQRERLNQYSIVAVWAARFCQGEPMPAPLARLSRLSLMAVGLVLHSAAPGLGQSMPVPSSAFARNAAGDWKVLAPVML
jgi:hypothetical protein